MAQQSPNDYNRAADTGYSLSQPFTVNVIQLRDAVNTLEIDKDSNLTTSTPQIYTFHKAMSVRVDSCNCER